MVITGTQLLIHFKWNGAISLRGHIRKIEWHLLIEWIYCKSLVILIENIPFNCLTRLCTFLLPIPFSPVNFHKYDKVYGDLCSVSHAKTWYCFSKVCKAKIEFFTNIWMARNAEKKSKQILRYNCSTKRPTQ